MRFTFIIGLVPAASIRGPVKLGRIVPPPPIDLLGPQNGVGVVPFKRDVVRVHRGERVTSPSFRAAVMSNWARWQHPGLTLDVKESRFLGPSRLLLVRTRNGRPLSSSGLGVGFHVRAGRYVALQVGVAVNA